VPAGAGQRGRRFQLVARGLLIQAGLSAASGIGETDGVSERPWPHRLHAELRSPQRRLVDDTGQIRSQARGRTASADHLAHVAPQVSNRWD